LLRAGTFRLVKVDGTSLGENLVVGTCVREREDLFVKFYTNNLSSGDEDYEIVSPTDCIPANELALSTELQSSTTSPSPDVPGACNSDELDATNASAPAPQDLRLRSNPLTKEAEEILASASAAFGRKDYRVVLTQCLDVLDLVGPNENAYVLAGDSFFAAKRYSEAAVYYKDAANMETSSKPLRLLLYGRCLAGLGQHGKAQGILQEAVNLIEGRARAQIDQQTAELLLDARAYLAETIFENGNHQVCH
jgi:tetratricopeptide (TPR) repeat protein